MKGIICSTSTFKPGDPPPIGYTAWHEWAEVQGKSGLKQTRCGVCGKWYFPQEFSGREIEYTFSKTIDGPKITGKALVCKTCNQED